jgi:hypothetical protein
MPDAPEGVPDAPAGIPDVAGGPLFNPGLALVGVELGDATPGDTPDVGEAGVAGNDDVGICGVLTDGPCDGAPGVGGAAGGAPAPAAFVAEVAPAM